MSRATTVKHVFLDLVPDRLDEATVYISIPHATVVHLCCCGCGREVVTPLSRTDWRLTFDGETISLDPSIGNWSFPCRSHYWIELSRVRWARVWSQKEIDAGRAADRAAKAAYFGANVPVQMSTPAWRRPWWRRLMRR